MEANEQKSAHSGYRFIIVVLALLLAGLTAWYIREARRWDGVSGEMEAVRDSLSHKLGDMLWEYDAVQTDNDDLRQELAAEKEKIQTLLQKMHANETVHYAEIRRYEREAGTLRDIMRSYIRQIDSLNTLSQRLIAENREVKKDLETSREENKKLSEEKETLSSQIEKGSVLKVRSLVGEGLNARDKTTRSAGTARKLKTCFVISENTIAKPGVRNAYLRITAPDRSLLENREGGTFNISAGALSYTARREVDYQNADLETCVYFDVKDLKLPKGAYTLEVYIDGSLSGTGEFLLR